MNGVVLDKKRLRAMMAGILTIFATVVPFLLTLYSSSNDAVAIYGQMANDSAIYAYRCVHQISDCDTALQAIGSRDNGLVVNS
jgi:hypothetical protein